MSRLRLSLVMSSVLAVGWPADAGNFQIFQKDFAFSQREVHVRVGDHLVFVNADPVPHNVYSLSKGQEFEIRSQMPGKSDAVPFDRPGVADVRCAIHPKMKLTVHIGP